MEKIDDRQIIIVKVKKKFHILSAIILFLYVCVIIYDSLICIYLHWKIEEYVSMTKSRTQRDAFKSFK